ncbi:MAG: hypothetical protein ABI477_01260 [Chryseolinea sp.]
MNQQPDKFFRDKLEGYQRPAPDAAWDKIISAERKKKHAALWLRIAASILPLMVAGYIMWSIERTLDSAPLARNNNNDKPVVQESSTASVDSGKTKDVSPAHLNNVPPSAEPTKTSESVLTNRIEKTFPKSNGRPSVNKNVKIKETLNEIRKEEVAQSIPRIENSPIASMSNEVGAADFNTKERETMTLVYTTSDVSQYLDKNIDDDATSNAKKPSTLKKLLMKANDLSAQDPFGELRQKKNEILALNFKGLGNVDKTRKQ